MQPGDVIADRFRIERLAAEGGMGAVYRARDLHTDALAAIKVVLSSDAQTLERFTREARVLAELRHPAIVQYLSHGRTARGELYLAMEWLEGEDLAQRLAARELSVSESLLLITEVAAALAVAHARQIVHRDVKPSNLFLVDYRVDRLKVLDFGIARLAGMDSVTVTGAVIGTPRFMAPEQALGARSVDARADVFALGGVLYRCLTGRHPFAGDTPVEVLANLVHGDAPRLAERRPELPRELDDLLTRMLAKDPARRPADAAAVLSEMLVLDLTPASAVLHSSSGLGELTEEERRVHCALVIGQPGGADVEGARRVVAAHGGCLEHTDDATVVILAGQRVATDQARLAARCALALRRELPGVPLALVIGRPDARRRAADAVARARRFLDAPADGIRLDDAAAGLLDARFTVAGDDVGLVLVGEQHHDDEARTLLGKPSPFVGREQELTQLEAIFAGCLGDGEARAVLVTGPPGLGKSRLRQELTRRIRQRAPEVEVWTARGDPMRAGAPFGLLGEAVRLAAGITGAEPVDAQRRLLLERAARHLPGERVLRVAELIGELAGVPFSADDSPRLRAARRDPVLLGDQMRAAWEELIAAECAAHPLVIVLEDMHWGDVPTVRFIDVALAAAREQPLMILGLARPEIHELFPRLWAERGLQTLQLGELSRKAGERLVREALGEGAGDVARLVERAAGNVFYLEELIRQVASGVEGSLPDTLLAMVEQRLQALSAEQRRLLRAASVFGEVFWAGGVETLVGGTQPAGQVERGLRELAEREVIRRRVDHAARFGDQTEYAFRHGLVRDAAYAMLTDADRVLGHRLAGEWLEAAGERDALVLAEHHERGQQRGRAVSSYARAAQQALAANDLTATVERAERGVALGANGVELGTLSLLAAEAERWRGDNPAAQRLSSEAMRALPRGSAAWFSAAGEAAAALGKLGRHEALRVVVDEIGGAGAGRALDSAQAIAMARAAVQSFFALHTTQAESLVAELRANETGFANDPGVTAWIYDALATAAAARSDATTSAAHYLAASEQHERAGDLRNACLERINAGDVLCDAEAWTEAERLLRPAIPIADGMALHAAGCMARGALAAALVGQGRCDEALDWAREAAASPAMGQPRLRCYALCQVGQALHGQGDLDGAERVLREAAGFGPTVITWPMAVIALARLLLTRGAAAAARDLLLPLMPALRQVPPMATKASLTYAEILLACDDLPAARVAIAAARDLVLAALARMPDETTRAACRAQPSHARIFELARVWLA